MKAVHLAVKIVAVLTVLLMILAAASIVSAATL